MNSTVEADKPKADAIVQISDVKVVVNDDVGKRPMVFEKSVNTPIQRPIMAHDHEANNSSVPDKYHQPRWCPLVDLYSKEEVAAPSQ